MSGTTGNDTLSLSDAANFVDLLAGNDTVLGNGGDDTLIGNIGNDTLRGGADNDSLLGSAGNDSLAGDAGNDWIEGGLGTDTLDGGSGIDTLSYANDTVGVGINLNNNGRDAVTNGGTASEADPGNPNSRDSIISASFEAVVGGSGADTLVGDGDNELLVGNGGSDSLLGNAGNDTIVGGMGADTIVGGSGNDILFGLDSTSGTDTMDGADSILGGDGNDTIAGGGGDDRLDGGTGDDFITGGFGADTLIGGTNGGGGDTVSYEFSPEAIAINLGAPGGQGGHAQGDSIVGFEGVVGSNFDDTLVGFNNFDNVLAGGGGNDSIVTILGDTALGGAGDDTLRGSPESGSQSQDWLDGGADNDLIEAKGGNDTVQGGTGDDTVIAGNGDGTDSLDGGDGFDRLDLRNWTGPTNFGTDDIASGTYGSWTISGATGPDALRTFTYSDGTVLNAKDFESIICFAEGTRIATARGEVPVETLRAGDLVLTAHAGAALQPLVWVGHTTVDVARHPNPARVAPVLIKAGALADGVPFRDLRVSPDHALYLDGRLVPAALLVNGTTIVQETWCRRVTYWHAELPNHGLLVSEGAITESYFDDGNRHLFDNAGIAAFAVDFAAHRPNGRYAAAACAPVVTEDDVVLDRIRARIAARAPARRATA